ncbi:MAG: DUF2520 domain-containing protein [Bryobacteraceae bacterium]
MGGGRASGTLVSRLPLLPGHLGPVAARSFRLARRFVNSLRAGYAVRHFRDLRSSVRIMIAAPEEQVRPLVAELAPLFDWRRKTVLLCSAGAGSGALERLRARGAATGSLEIAPGGGRLVAEGDRTALIWARQLARQLDLPLDEVAPHKLGVYRAGVSFASSLVAPLMDSATACLCEAGVSRNVAMKMMEASILDALRGYLYSGRKSWRGPVADGDRAKVLHELEALVASDPSMAKHYRWASLLALERMGRHPDLVRFLAEFSPGGRRAIA